MFESFYEKFLAILEYALRFTAVSILTCSVLYADTGVSNNLDAPYLKMVVDEYEQALDEIEKRCDPVFYLSREPVIRLDEIKYEREIQAKSKGCKRYAELYPKSLKFLYRYAWSLLLPVHLEPSLEQEGRLYLIVDEISDIERMERLFSRDRDKGASLELNLLYAIDKSFAYARDPEKRFQSVRDSVIEVLVRALFDEVDHEIMFSDRRCYIYSFAAQFLRNVEVTGDDSINDGDLEALMRSAYLCGDIEAYYYRGLSDLEAYENSPDEQLLKSAIEHLEFAAEQGLNEAKVELFKLYFMKGYGLYDRDLAERWYCSLPVSWRVSESVPEWRSTLLFFASRNVTLCDAYH